MEMLRVLSKSKSGAGDMTALHFTFYTPHPDSGTELNFKLAHSFW